DLTILATRTVPACDSSDAASFLQLLPSRLLGTSPGRLPLLAFLRNIRGLFGVDLPCRKVPMLIMPAVRLPLGLPKGIGALLDTLVLLNIHQHPPKTPPPTS